MTGSLPLSASLIAVHVTVTFYGLMSATAISGELQAVGTASAVIVVTL